MNLRPRVRRVATAGVFALAASLAAPTASFAAIDAPTGITLTVSGTTATITYVRPMSTPVGAIVEGLCQTSEYDLSKSPAENIKMLNAFAAFPVGLDKLVASNLRTNTRYTCSMRIYQGNESTGYRTASPAGVLVTGSTTPAPVTKLYGVPTPSAITLYFTPSNAERYNAVCAPVNGGASVNASAKSAPLLVNGLTAGAPYRCTVTATTTPANAAPLSSAPVTAANVTPLVVPAAAPASPILQSVKATGTTVELVVLPNTSGGSVSSFSGLCVLSNTTTAPIMGTSSTERIALTLPTSGSYTCSATANNGYGTSPASAPIKVTVTAPLTKPAAPAIVKTGVNGTATMVRLSTPAFANSLLYQFTCRAADGSNTNPPITQRSDMPTVAMDLGQGNWLCFVSSYQASGWTEDSASTAFSSGSTPVVTPTAVSAPKITVSSRTATVYRPSGITGEWSAICQDTKFRQVGATGKTSTLKMKLIPGSYACQAVSASGIKVSKSTKITVR